MVCKYADVNDGNVLAGYNTVCDDAPAELNALNV